MTVQAGRKNLWLWVGIAVAVVLVAGAAGVGLRYWQTKGSKPAATTASSRPLQPDVSAAQDAALRGDYSAAHQQLSAALSNPKLSNDDKYALLVQQGATYQNQGNYQGALDNYQTAAQLKQTQNVYESMAVVAEQLGNKDLAITYYKKAIQLISPNNLVGGDDKDSYEQKIRSLGGQP